MAHELIYNAADNQGAKVSGDILRGGIKLCDEILLIPEKIKQRGEFRKQYAHILESIETEQ